MPHTIKSQELLAELPPADPISPKRPLPKSLELLVQVWSILISENHTQNENSCICLLMYRGRPCLNDIGNTQEDGLWITGLNAAGRRRRRSGGIGLAPEGDSP